RRDQRRRVQADRGDYSFDDAEGARESRVDQRQSQAADRGGQRDDRAGGEPPAQTVRRYAHNDEDRSRRYAANGQDGRTDETITTKHVYDADNRRKRGGGQPAPGDRGRSGGLGRRREPDAASGGHSGRQRRGEPDVCGT